MSQETTTTLVPFHGDEILCIDTPEGVFVAVTPICERLKIDPKTQRKKLLAAQERWRGELMPLPSGRGEQKTYCIPLTKVASWLSSINASRVKPEMKEALLAYQNEADEVLDRHFRLKEAEKEAEIAHLRAQLDQCHLHLQLAMPKWAKIAAMKANGRVPEANMALRLNMSFNRMDDEIGLMEECGLLPPKNLADTRAHTLLDRNRKLDANLWVVERRLAEAERRLAEAKARAPEAIGDV